MSEEKQSYSFERSIEAADKRLKVIQRQQKLQQKMDRIFHTFNKAFEDVQKNLKDATKLEAHSDRVCFEIRDVPISIIYVPQSQPTYIMVNKQNILAEKVFICDKYFGKNSYEMVGPSEREVGAIFVTEETYLVRWNSGKAFFYPGVYELVDSTLVLFFALCEMYKDKYGNPLEVNAEDYQHKVTPLDLLTSGSAGIEDSSSSIGKFTSKAPESTQVKKAPTNIYKNMRF